MSTEVQFNLYNFSEETLEFLYDLPSEFPPSAHTHSVNDLTDLVFPVVPDLTDGEFELNVASVEANSITVNSSLEAFNATINGRLTANDIQGNLTGNLYVDVRAGQDLLKGDPVYISGTYTSGPLSLPIVSRADSSNPAKMPAAGIMDVDLLTDGNGQMVISGRVSGFNTNLYDLNAELYVGSGGGFTATSPASLPQPIARVSRKDSNNGSIIVKIDGIAGAGPQGPPGDGVAGNNDVGVIYLKNNATATTIPSVETDGGRRAVVAGTMQTGICYNFEKDATTNSLKYTGDGGRFHIVATFNFYSGPNDTCGFYIGKNTVPASALDPNTNRISESEVYAIAVSQTKPASAAIQTVVDLSTGDRIFFIVQNKDGARNIKVEFLKFVAVTLTAEKGDVGPEGPPVDTSTLVPYSGATGAVDLGTNRLDAGDIFTNGVRVATAVDPVRTTLTGNGATSTYNIGGAANLINPSALIVAIDGVLQEPVVDYSVNNGTITFTEALANGAKAVVISPSNALVAGQVTPSDGSVTSSKIATGVTLTTPSLVGPVDLISQDATTADRVMTRRLVGDYTHFSRDLFRSISINAVGAGATVRRNSANIGVVDGDLGTNAANGQYVRFMFVSGSLDNYFDGATGSAVSFSRPWTLFTKVALNLTVNTQFYTGVGVDATTGIPSNGTNIGFQFTSNTSVRLWRCNGGAAVFSSDGAVSNIPVTYPYTGFHYIWLECVGNGTINLYLAYSAFGSSPMVRPSTALCTLTGVGAAAGARIISSFLYATGTPGGFTSAAIGDARFIEY